MTWLEWIGVFALAAIVVSILAAMPYAFLAAELDKEDEERGR